MTDRATTRFLIICAPRTGSTMLRVMLNSHPDICCHGEVFAQPLIRGFVGLKQGEKSPMLSMLQEIRDADPVAYLRDYVFYAEPCPTVGCKILYNTLEHPRWALLFEHLQRSRDVRIVHLVRENRLKRYLSHHIAAKITNVKVAAAGQERPVVPKVVISPSECLRDLAAVEEDDKRFRQLFRDHRTFELSYEQILDSTSGRIDDLQRFLNVAPQSLQQGTQKIVSDDLREVIANYDEVAKAFRGTPYEHWIA